METFVQKQLKLLSSGVPEKEAIAIEKIYSEHFVFLLDKKLKHETITKNDSN